MKEQQNLDVQEFKNFVIIYTEKFFLLNYTSQVIAIIQFLGKSKVIVVVVKKNYIYKT